jgi:hypothetical protein
LAPISYKTQKTNVQEAISALEELIKQGATIGEDGEIEVTQTNRTDAENIFTGVNKLRPTTPPGVLIHLHSLLQEYNHKVVQSAEQVRTYVTNRLIEESANEDPKIRMQALVSLGKITDVGLFTERTETKITHGTSEELESALRGRLKRLIDLDKKDYADVEEAP